MNLIVQKFGGSSVCDAQRIMNVARIISDTYRAGNQIIAVLSAQGDTTDDLIDKAKEINPRASKREMDMLLSTGEQVSIALCAMALESMGLPVISLAAWQVVIQTTSTHSSARIKKIDHERIQQELDKNKIVLVAGFQGVNCFGDVTTLGRGGSDTSAVALAAAFQADLCQIYTDVDGVYTTDPRIVPNAKKLPEITYDEMLELASQGAQVLHSRSVELAKKYRVNLEVLSSLERKPGTKVKEFSQIAKNIITGVTKDTTMARISLVGLEHTPGSASNVFSLLKKADIHVDTISSSFDNDDGESVIITLAENALQDAVAFLEEKKKIIGFDHIAVDDHIAKVSIICTGMMITSGVEEKMVKALNDANINIQMINTSEKGVSAIIDQQKANAAVRAIHDKFFSDTF